MAKGYVTIESNKADDIRSGLAYLRHIGFITGWRDLVVVGGEDGADGPAENGADHAGGETAHHQKP